MTAVDPVTGEIVKGDRLPILAAARDIEVGWFETKARAQIDALEPDDLVAGWETAVAQDELLDRFETPSIEMRRAVRWAERRIGVLLGDSVGGRGLETPKAFRGLDPVQRSAFRKMAGVDAEAFRAHLVSTDDMRTLSRAGVARWAERAIKVAEESHARDTAFDATVADASGDGWKLLHGDFRERLLELEPGSVDMILTDPPYPAEFLPLWSDLAEVAARILKPQGVLAALTGQIYLPDVSNRLGEHLAYGWTYCQPLPGQQSRIMGRHVLQSWKPWLIYTNGTWPSGRIEWHPDMLDPSYRAKDQYRWQQDPNPTLLLIDALSTLDALIVDPFTGTGSYGIAALTMGRTFVGCELDLDRFEAGKKRLERGVS
jgi:hypothetical protein